MTAVLSPIWGPYLNINEARDRLCRFVDKASAPDVGVIWAADGVIYPLRPPRQKGQGEGDVVIFQWTRLPPPTPRPPSGFWPQLKAFLKDCAEQEGRAAEINAQANMAMGQSMNRVLGRMFSNHRDDAAGVALDVLCIALSLALIPTGIGFLGVIGLAGGAALLAMDGKAYAMELSGDDKGAEVFKKQTEAYRIVATVMTLPDLFKGGYVAIKELREVAELLPATRQTAASAEALAARTTNANRAERFAQIAERAHLRAQLRREQIAASLKFEITPRGGGVGSISLLVREEIQNESSLYHQFLSRLQVHCTAVHR